MFGGIAGMVNGNMAVGTLGEDMMVGLAPEDAERRWPRRTSARLEHLLARSLCATRLIGKLKGVIAATTPIGTGIVRPTFPAPAAAASIGTARPAAVRATEAENRYVITARSTSASASLIGFPTSAVTSDANSSRRLSRASATRSRISARACVGSPCASASDARATAARAASARATA
jgi:hypothetical protein